MSLQRFLLLAAWFTGSYAGAVEISLRERCQPSGPVVRLGDLADVGAAGAEELDDLTTTPLLPAPAPGAVRYLRAAEIRDLLALRGLNVASLRFAGAPVVAVGVEPRVAAVHPHVRIAVDPAAVEQAVETKIVDYLAARTGHSHWRVEASGNEQLWNDVAYAPAAGAVAGGQAPWTGQQKFLLSEEPGQTGTSVLARVIRLEHVVVATRSIARGELVRASDLELQAIETAVPARAAREPQALVGQEAATAIAAGAIVMQGSVRSPIVVRRGELVTVIARTQGITARTVATAQQDGAVGDLVIVEAGAAKAKRRFTARVAGYRELEVFAAPTSTSEVALR